MRFSWLFIFAIIVMGIALMYLGYALGYSLVFNYI
jgi:hypothetical protein